MSFSQNAKKEILNYEFSDDMTAFAFLSGLIKGAGVLKTSNSGSVIEILTELPFLHDFINKIAKQYYGQELEMETVNDYQGLKIVRYKSIIPAQMAQVILNDISITHLNDNDEIIKTSGIDYNVIVDEETKRAYIKGIFVATATSNIVIKNYSNNKKHTSGYHLEFVFNNNTLAEDFIKLLQDFEIQAKITVRKDLPIVYIKEYQLICDALALVGANKSVLNLQNEAAIREVRNNVNRQLNCFNANLSKTVESSLRQLEAIRVIQETVGLEYLEENLSELAILRIANPDEPLAKLKELYGKDISKSGVNHRLEKIIKIADKIKEDQRKNNNQFK